MARKVDVQYIRYYTDGNAARKVEPAVPLLRPIKKKRTQSSKRLRVYVDPLAMIGVVVAITMLILMAVGVNRLKAAQRETVRMEEYVTRLQAENEQLHTAYSEGYDLETVERLALALGMVPKDQLPHIEITLPEEPEVVELTLWDRVCIFFTELFA